MSFSNEIKNELCKIETKKPCCLKAECYGAFLFSKCFSLEQAAFVTENAAAAGKMAQLAAEVCGVSAKLSFTVSRMKKQAYRLECTDMGSREKLLACFGHTGRETSLRLNRSNIENDCCAAAFLRGAFLSCGTASDPEREYRLEYTVRHSNLAKDFFTLLREADDFNFLPLTSTRKGKYVVYLKESGQIEDLVTYMGASGASMQLMQAKMFKEAKNDINRKSNFETANMDKSFSASARQVAAIAKISDRAGLESLPEELRTSAEARLLNPDMPLRELAKKLGMSGSTLLRKLSKLEKLSDEGIS